MINTYMYLPSIPSSPPSLCFSFPLSPFSLYTPFLIFISWHFPFSSLSISLLLSLSLPPSSLSLFHPPCFAPYKAWIYMVILNHSPCYGISLFLFNYIFFGRLYIFFHSCYFFLILASLCNIFLGASSSRRYPHERDVITRTWFQLSCHLHARHVQVAWPLYCITFLEILKPCKLICNSISHVLQGEK